MINGHSLNDFVQAIGFMKVSDVRSRDVIEVVEAKAENTPSAAAQVSLYARRMMDYATDRDYSVANPLAGLKPLYIKGKGKRDPLKSVARGRVLDHDEVRFFGIMSKPADFINCPPYAENGFGAGPKAGRNCRDA